MNPTTSDVFASTLVKLGRVLLLVFLFISHPAWAALSPEIERGLAWLSAQVQADGTLAGEASSLAADLQARSEAARTLRLLTGQPHSLLTAAVLAASDDSTEYVARQLMLLEPADPLFSSRLSRLLARQNTDGGFGGTVAFGSNPGGVPPSGVRAEVLGLAR